jgi:predicted HAD superfamily hydrolase
LGYPELEANLSSYNTVSLDLFDTLFVRRYYFPDLAKRQLGEYLVQEELIAGAQAFVELRNQIELELRKSNNFEGDVCLIEVYNEMVTALGLEYYSIEQLSTMEFEEDLKGFVARKKMVEILERLKNAGKEIYFITDIYYTEEQVRRILELCGIKFRYKLYVSSALSLRKDNGTMWTYLLDNNLIIPCKHVHLGDNLVSDVQIPGDFGIAAEAVLNPMDKWLLSHGSLPDSFKGIFSDSSYAIGSLIFNQGYNPFSKS